MTKLSVVILTKNESSNIEKCIQSVDWADEIVVCDAGSSDNTIELATRRSAKVYVESSWQGYGVQRQRAQSHATGDWILMVDADERVTDALKNEILSCIERNESQLIYAIPRLSWAFGRFIRHGGWYPDYVLRLYRRNETTFDNALVHEKLIQLPTQRIVRLKSPMLHYTYRSVNHYLLKSAQYANAWAEQSSRSGKKSSLSNATLHAFACFFRMYILKGGFLDGSQGFLLAVLSANSNFVKYGDLWARKQNPPE